MTDRLSKLVTVVARDHFPRRAPKKAALSALEKRVGHKLPADVCAFYARHDGASRRVAIVATFGKPKLNAIGEAEAKPRG